MIDLYAQAVALHEEHPDLYRAVPEGWYTVAAACFNCGWRGLMKLPRGTRVPLSYDCPRCGCHEVRGRA